MLKKIDIRTNYLESSIGLVLSNLLSVAFSFLFYWYFHYLNGLLLLVILQSYSLMLSQVNRLWIEKEWLRRYIDYKSNYDYSSFIYEENIIYYNALTNFLFYISDIIGSIIMYYFLIQLDYWSFIKFVMILHITLSVLQIGFQVLFINTYSFFSENENNKPNIPIQTSTNNFWNMEFLPNWSNIWNKDVWNYIFAFIIISFGYISFNVETLSFLMNLQETYDNAVHILMFDLLGKTMCIFGTIIYYFIFKLGYQNNIYNYSFYAYNIYLLLLIPLCIACALSLVRLNMSDFVQYFMGLVLCLLQIAMSLVECFVTQIILMEFNLDKMNTEVGEYWSMKSSAQLLAKLSLLFLRDFRMYGTYALVSSGLNIGGVGYAMIKYFRINEDVKYNVYKHKVYDRVSIIDD